MAVDTERQRLYVAAEGVGERNERASLSPSGETESVPMIGCIPRETEGSKKGLTEEAFNTCGIVPLLSIKRIDGITINTAAFPPASAPRRSRRRGRISPSASSPIFLLFFFRFFLLLPSFCFCS